MCPHRLKDTFSVILSNSSLVIVIKSVFHCVFAHMPLYCLVQHVNEILSIKY